jgi:hypothetical protein
MNPKLVTIGVIAALAVLMIGTLPVGTHNAFAREYHRDQFNVNNQDSEQICLSCQYQ